MRVILVLGITFLANMALAANAAPRLNPQLPLLSEFSSCKKDTSSGDFDSIESCFETDKLQSVMGKPVDGDKSKRHFGWILKKYIDHKRTGSTYYHVSQVAYDCVGKKSIIREVQGTLVVQDQLPRSKTFDLRNWKDAGVTMSSMKSHCPPRKGFVRMNRLEVGIAYAVRKGNRVNVEAVAEDGNEFVFAVNCHSMTYGVGEEPKTPIKPRSVAYEIYKRLCSG